MPPIDAANFLAICIALNFFVLVALMIVNFRNIVSQFSKIKKKTWFLLALIFFAGFAMRFTVPHYHKMYIDEQWNMEVGKNILIRGRAVQCNYAGYDELSCISSVKPIGVSFIYSLSFLFFGINNFVAIDTSAFFGSLSIFLIFLVSYLLSKRESVGLFSALSLSFFPLHIFWSASAESNVISIFFMLLTLLFSLVYLNSCNFRVGSLAIVSLLYTLQIRLECVLLIPTMALMFLFFDGKKRVDTKKLNFLIFGLLCALFVISWLAQIATSYEYLSSNYVRSHELDDSAKYENFGFGYLRLNGVIGNILDYYPKVISGFYFPVILNFLFFIGLLNFKKNRRPCIFALSLLFLFSVFFMFYDSIQVRLILPSFFGLIFIASFGADNVLGQIMKVKYGDVWSILFIILMLFSFYPSLTEVYAYRDDKKFLESQIPEMAEKGFSENCIIVAPLPEIFTATTRIKAIRSESVVRDSEILKELKSRTDCVLFFEDMVCQGLELQNFKEDKTREQHMMTKESFEEECTFMKAGHILTHYMKYESKDMDGAFVFYRIS